MRHAELREQVFRANLALVRAGLVVLTWGNASGADRAAGVMAIKPSGVDYAALTPADIVVVSLATGQTVDGGLRPSSDAPTHLRLYRDFPEIGGVSHTHSPHATSWAQAGREIPCLGTTHADLAFGPVPLARALTAEEIDADYEENTGKIIVERFRQAGLNPLETPAVLVKHHGPFAWGADAISSAENAAALEAVAQMASHTLLLDPHCPEIPAPLLKKHFLRKHGQNAYYGQKTGKDR